MGNVSSLRIDSILDERTESEFIYDSHGYITLNYRGDIEVQIPEFDEITVPPLNSGFTYASFPEKPSTQQDTILATNRSLMYSIPAPEKNTASEDWTIEVEGVTFEECNIQIRVYLTGVNFFSSDGSHLSMNLNFPEYFVLGEHAAINGQDIGISIDPHLISQSTTGYYEYGPLPVKEVWYDKGEEDILYTSVLTVSPEADLTIDSGKEIGFRMEIRTDDSKPELVYADASFNQQIKGEIDDINSINDIFQEEGDYFVFANPGMIMDAYSNIGMDLALYMEEMRALLSGTLENMTVEEGMLFPKDETETSYYLAKDNDKGFDADRFFPVDFNEVLASKPTELRYHAWATTPGGSQKGYFPYKDAQIDANYTFTVPLNFSEIRINIE
ncbi:MAG: hypothetical protein LUD15_05995 [Bacteroides sp.]|nr:hypothetical protein [Bacteroides sp.]